MTTTPVLFYGINAAPPFNGPLTINETTPGDVNTASFFDASNDPVNQGLNLGDIVKFGYAEIGESTTLGTDYFFLDGKFLGNTSDSTVSQVLTDLQNAYTNDIVNGGNNTAQLAIDDAAIEAGRLGVPVSTINEPFFDSAGHLVQNTTPPPPPPTVATYDNGNANNQYGVGSLAQVLSNVFLIPQGSAIAASVPAPGAWELVYGGGTPPSGPQAIAEVPDASGNAPSVLAFNFLSGNFSVADWAGLQDVVLCSGPGLTIALTVTGSQNLNFYSTDLTVSQLSGTSFNSYVTNLTLADTGNDNVFLGNADGDVVHAGGGTDHISLGVAGTTVGGVGDQIFGGTGANQTLIANLAGATITDGTGTNQTLSALGGNATVNVVNGASDTVNSQGGGNTINVAAFAGTETITGTSTDTLNFADSFSNATFAHLANGGEEIKFNDTGQIVYVFGIDQASFAGTVDVFPPSTPATSDLNATDLANLLGSLLDANDASLLETWAANHLPKDGLTPVETNGSTIPFPGLTTLIPDAEGTNPQILIAENQTATGGYTIDTTGLTGLHAIILPDAQDGGYTGVYNTGGTHLTLNGSHAVKLYLGDLAGQESDGNYYYIDFSGQGSGIEDTANNTILGGNDNHDYVHAGAGADHVTLGTGTGDVILGGIGSNQVLETLGAQATISDNAAGGTLLIKALGGSSTVNVGDNSSIETVRLGGTASNTVNVGLGAGSITIDGLTATDHLNFADTQANATITKISATEETIHFADTGQSVDLHFANHVAEVAIIGSLNYGA